MDILSAIENSGVGIWVRESGSLWAYPTIIFFHSLGLSFLVGMSVALDLRLLGVARGLPLAPLERLYPIMWVGFWINAISGVALSIADAATMLVSGVFWVKMTCIVAAVVTMIVIRRQLFSPSRAPVLSVPLKTKILAGSSLALWAAAITAGRLTAYLGPVAGLLGR